MISKRITIAAAAIAFAISGALFAQSRDRSGRSERSSSRSSGTSAPAAAPAPGQTQPVASTSTAPASTSAALPPPPEFARPSQVLTGDFDILNHKSIFERDRRLKNVRAPRTEPERTWQPSTPPPRPPGIPVLVGVLLGDDSYIAFLEDPDSGKLFPFAPGDPLPQDFGTVKDITLDYMEFAKDDGPLHRIPVGQNLKGDVATTTTTTASPAPTDPATPVDPNAPELTFEQKMKLKRQKEMGGG